MCIKGGSVACAGIPFGVPGKVYSGFRGDPDAWRKSK